MRDIILNNISNKYSSHLLDWDNARIQMELAVINSLFNGVLSDTEEIEWYSLCYNYLEEELIRRKEAALNER